MLPPALPPSPALSHVHSNDVSGLSTAPPSPPASLEPQSASGDPPQSAGSEDGRSRTATFDEADEEDDDGEGGDAEANAGGEGGDAAAGGGDRSGASGGGGGGGKQRKKKGGKKGGKQHHQHGKDKKQPPPPRDSKSTTPPAAVTLVAAKATPAKSDALTAARHAAGEEEPETVRVCVAALDALAHPCALPPRRTGALRRASVPPSGSRGNQSASPALSAAPGPWSGGPAAAQPPPPNFDPAELWAMLVAWVVTYSHTNLYHGPFFQLLRAALRLGHEPTLRHILQSGRLVTTFVTHYVDSTPVPIAGGGGGGHHQQQLRLPGFGLDAAEEAAPPPIRMKTRAQRRAEASGARGAILRALNAVRLAAQVGRRGVLRGVGGRRLS